ncbi:MAG: redoxin domain-containing protein [Candidatus Aminicenantes bacterium]|nr:redoxin domain-containing protein [Candidatus Aminicenantes bacterium]
MKRTVMMVLSLSLLGTLAAVGEAGSDPFAAEYEALNNSIEKKMAAVQSRDQFQKLMAERQAALEELLAKYAAGPAGDPAELLRARILVDLKRSAEAESKLRGLIGRKGPQQDEARLILAKALTETGKTGEAVPLFRRVEARVPRGPDFFAVAFSLAFEAPDDEVRSEFCRKLLAAGDLPKAWSRYRPYLVTTRAEIAMKKRDIAGARKILQDGLKEFSDEKDARSLRSALKQLEFIGRPAPEIAAETWLNSPPLSLKALRGKVVVIDFWAPWCGPCRQVIPTLAKDYGELKGKGLVVIGFTKLYGRYSDEVQNKGAVGPDEERGLIQGFAKRWKMTYPLAISDKGQDFDDYGVSGIPTMVFIDRGGRIYEVKVGSGDEAAISAKIRKLLAGK